MIFTFHVASTYHQIYYLTGKNCKTWSVFLLLMLCFVFFLIKQLMPSSKATRRSVNTALHLQALRIISHCLFLMTHHFKSKNKIRTDKMFISISLQVDKKRPHSSSEISSK